MLAKTQPPRVPSLLGTSQNRYISITTPLSSPINNTRTLLLEPSLLFQQTTLMSRDPETLTFDFRLGLRLLLGSRSSLERNHSSPKMENAKRRHHNSRGAFNRRVLKPANRVKGSGFCV